MNKPLFPERSVDELLFSYATLIAKPGFPSRFSMDIEHARGLYERILNQIEPHKFQKEYQRVCEGLKLLDPNFPIRKHKPYYEGWGFQIPF